MYKKNKLTINEIKGRWKNGILNLLNVPEVEKYEQKERSFVNVLGEILTLFRPLLTIVAIRIFGIKSFKPFLISLFIDLIVTFLLHKGIKAESEDERE